jgi:hypothetical protein
MLNKLFVMLQTFGTQFGLNRDCDWESEGFVKPYGNQIEVVA